MKKAIFTLLLIVLFAVATEATINSAEASPMIFLPFITIKSDGSIEPQTGYIQQVGNTYTLTDNLFQSYSIKIQRSNTVFDGEGYTIDGSLPNFPGYGYGGGLMLENVVNVTVRDIRVVGFMSAHISMQNSSASTILKVKAGNFELRDSNFNTIAESNTDQLLFRYSNSNTIVRNNITSVDLGSGYGNQFFENNFSTKFIWPVNEENSWDNSSVGNYWRDYNGSDANNDGIGDTPYIIYSNNFDNFPLMQPWDPAKPIDSIPPQILVSSPQNTVYSESSVQLTFNINEPASSMSYSINGQTNVTISGNITLSWLPNGQHNLAVYATDNRGNTGVSQVIYFSVSAPFPTLQVIAVIAVTAAIISIALIAVKIKRHKIAFY